MNDCRRRSAASCSGSAVTQRRATRRRSRRTMPMRGRRAGGEGTHAWCVLALALALVCLCSSLTWTGWGSQGSSTPPPPQKKNNKSITPPSHPTHPQANHPALWLGRHARQGGPAVDTRNRWRQPPPHSLYHHAMTSPQVIHLTRWDAALRDCPRERWAARGACTARPADGRQGSMCAPSVFIPGGGWGGGPRASCGMGCVSSRLHSG